jgi:hypothetical protein
MKRLAHAAASAFLALGFTAPAAGHECQVLDNIYLRGDYEGDCLEKYEVAHGHGEARGNDTYVGDFVKGRPEGKGVYTWENGASLDGMFTWGKADGPGTYISAKGIRYEGPFSKGKLVGARPEDCPATRGPLQC